MVHRYKVAMLYQQMSATQTKLRYPGNRSEYSVLCQYIWDRYGDNKTDPWASIQYKDAILPA